MEILSLESLATLEGGIVANLINRELRKAYLDCHDRPMVEAARTVALTIKIKPKTDDMQDATVLGLCAVEFQVPAAKLPPQAMTRAMQSCPEDAGLGFQPDTRSTKFDRRQRNLDNPEE